MENEDIISQNQDQKTEPINVVPAVEVMTAIVAPVMETERSLAKIETRRKMKKPLTVLVCVLMALALFSAGLYVGLRTSQSAKQKLVGAKILPEKYKDVDFSKFWEALEGVESKYIGNIDYGKLVDGAIAGMVSGLEDPFTTYFNKQDLGTFNNEITGTFEGIGAEVSSRDGKIVVVAPIEGAPAQKAGLRSGDIIRAIDGESVEGVVIDAAVLKMRGKKGTTVSLTVSREEEADPIEIKIKRDVINVKSVEYKDMGDGIAYIRILRFDGNTKSLFEQYAGEIMKNKAKGLILDVRSNPGGYLDSAVDISSEFIKDGVIVIEEYKDGKRDETKASGKGKLFDIPMVMLINGGSASGSEILAGAIRDHKRGVLIGEKTFGKGSVQEMSPLSTGGALKITIAKWLTPNGSAIDKNGLNPDIEVKWEEDKNNLQKDNQLDRALEEVKKIAK